MRGSPSATIPMMSRWTSLVPPPKVRIRHARCIRSTRPRSNAPGEFCRTGRPGTQHLHQQPVGLGGQLGAEYFGRRRIGGRQGFTCRRTAEEFPVDQLEHLGLGVHPGQVELHPLRVDEPRPAGVLGVLRPLANLAQGQEYWLRRHQGDALVIELVGHQLPATVLLADQVGHRHPHVRVVGGAGVHTGHGVHRRPGKTLGGGRHDQHRDAAVLLGLRVGAHRQPDPVGVCDQAGPHLLAVDHVVVAVADRGGTQVGQVGAGTGLRVADREVQFAGGDLGQEEFLLFLGAERHDRRRHAVDRQERHWHACDRSLVGKDQRVHRGPVLAAVLLGPVQGEPPVLAHLCNGVAIRVAGPDLALRRAQCLATLGRHQRGEVRPQLATQLLLFRGVTDAHSSRPPPMRCFTSRAAAIRPTATRSPSRL